MTGRGGKGSSPEELLRETALLESKRDELTG
jgi:hypothetical protein